MNWSFSFRISPFNEYSRLISFRIDWFDLLVVQGTLKSLFQHHSSKASVLGRSAFSFLDLCLFSIFSSNFLFFKEDGLTFSPYDCGAKNSPAPRPAWPGRSQMAHCFPWTGWGPISHMSLKNWVLLHFWVALGQHRALTPVVYSTRTPWRPDQKSATGTSLVVQWWRLCAPNSEGPGSISWPGN